MKTVQGKNVVIVGGLQGVGLKLTKNLLSKRVQNLYIIDFNENQDTIQDLKSRYQSTNIFFKRISEVNFTYNFEMALKDVTLKMKYIDVFINATELMVNNDLQRTMDINMKIHLNAIMAVFAVMDRNNGGRGGKIVNVLSNLCLEDMKSGANDHQYLINKQMLLSLTETFSQDELFQQSGVSVMSVMPVISQDVVGRNSEWIKNVGMEKLVNNINNVNTLKYTNSFDDEEEDFCEKNIFDFEIHNFHQDNTSKSDLYSDSENYYQAYDLELEERLRDCTNNIRRVFNVLCSNMVRGIEKGQNGSKMVVGLEGIKCL